MNFVEINVKNRIGFITLNRPEKRNALSAGMVSELKEAFSQIEREESVKVVILGANGSVFSAGADLDYLQQLQQNTYEENLSDSRLFKELLLKIYLFPKPVIAQIQGHAIAGGCGLITVCDFAFSLPEAKFGYTEIRIGFIPALVMVFLLRKIGEARARQLLVSGKLITADDALSNNLINKIVDADHLEEKVELFARELIEKNSATSMGITKKMIAEVQSMPLNEALDYASEMNAKARATKDCQRGIAAFLNKEKIMW